MDRIDLELLDLRCSLFLQSLEPVGEVVCIDEVVRARIAALAGRQWGDPIAT